MALVGTGALEYGMKPPSPFDFSELLLLTLLVASRKTERLAWRAAAELSEWPLTPSENWPIALLLLLMPIYFLNSSRRLY